MMDAILREPDPNKFFCNMTHLYHTDALTYPQIDYQKLKMPFLVVTRAFDTISSDSDFFVAKAKEQSGPITYFRIPDMDHYVRMRPDIIQSSFHWLKKQLDEN